MKFDFNWCKIKKITAIEIFVAVIILVAVGIYYSPHFMQEKEIRMAAKIKTDNSIFISKVLQEFAQNKNAKTSEVAKKVAQELNSVSVNYFDKKEEAYTFESQCRGCNSIEYNDEQSMIIVSTFNKKGEMLARTVIKPPSFVTYVKSADEYK